MLEIEQKFARVDFDDLERRLAAWGASPGVSLEEADHYFNAPDRDFAVTDEALRLRRIAERNFVTYKGPKRDASTKTRTEIEVPLAPGDGPADDFTRLLISLGYRPVGVVRKARRLFHLKREADEIRTVPQLHDLSTDEPDPLTARAPHEPLEPVSSVTEQTTRTLEPSYGKGERR